MRYVIYSLGFFLTLLLVKPLGIFLAAILGIGLSSLATTLLIDNKIINKLGESPASKITETTSASTTHDEISEEIKPSTKISKSQINVLYALLCGALIILAIHNPTDGYIKTISHNEYAYSDLKEYNLNEVNCYTYETPSSLLSHSRQCEYELPMKKWVSKGSLTGWFAYFGNAAWALFILVCFAAVGFMYFRPKNANR